MDRRNLLLSTLLLTALALLVAVPPACDAGEGEAALATERGDKALKAKRWTEAAELYRGALEEMESYLPARCGLGKALLGSGDEAAARAAFRRVHREAEGRATVPEEWQSAVKKARGHLAKIDESGTALERIIDDHVRDLVALAERHKTRDPDLVERALTAALTLRADNARALALRGRLSSKGARREALFDGKQIADWDGGRSKWWQVEDGQIVADASGVATYIRTEKRIEGDFDVLMEARILDDSGKTPFLALMAAWNAEYDHSRFGVLNDALTWYEEHDKDTKDRVFRRDVKRLAKALDPAAWNTYELRYRGKKIIAVVNGKEVASTDRSEKRAGGFVGILAQDCKAAIRRVDVVKR